MLPREKDAAMPDTDFNGGSGGKAACKDLEVVVDQDKEGFAEHVCKGEVSKPDEFLGVALAAKSNKNREAACIDVEVDKVKDDKRDGSKPG